MEDIKEPLRGNNSCKCRHEIFAMLLLSNQQVLDESWKIQSIRETKNTFRFIRRRLIWTLNV